MMKDGKKPLSQWSGIGRAIGGERPLCRMPLNLSARFVEVDGKGYEKIQWTVDEEVEHVR